MREANKLPNNKEFPLTRETWRYIKQRQKELDDAFLSKAKWLPNDNARLSALLIERGELINEFPETFKWWKHKADDRVRIIDEYIDLLHFLAGMESDYSRIMFEAETDKWRQWSDKYVLEQLLDYSPDREYPVQSACQVVALATHIMGRLGFTDGNILVAYDAKNAENFKRIAEGY
jgi:dimeric dUTPase (all-alpha-NTP-PPase superfamily)